VACVPVRACRHSSGTPSQCRTPSTPWSSSQPSLATDETVRRRWPIRWARSSPKRSSRRATVSAPRGSCQAITGASGAPLPSSGAPLSAMPATATATTRRRSSPIRPRARPTAAWRVSAATSTPSIVLAKGVVVLDSPTCPPASSTIMALIVLEPMSIPRTTGPAAAISCPVPLGTSGRRAPARPAPGARSTGRASAACERDPPGPHASVGDHGEGQCRWPPGAAAGGQPGWRPRSLQGGG